MCFVSPNGNDTNPGTQAAPVRTPQRAQQLVRALNTAMSGDVTVVLANGFYRLAALVRRPSSRLAEGLVTHLARSLVDVGLARRQWQRYVGELAAAGWDCVEAPPVDDCPDGVFVEDTMVVFGDLAVIARPGSDERQPEVDAAREMVAAQGYRTVSIEPPGTLDGGDVLKIGEAVYAGRSRRTNDAGIEQLRSSLAPLGGRVVAVAVTKVLHLKSAVTALPDGTVIGYPSLVDDPEVFDSFLPCRNRRARMSCCLGMISCCSRHRPGDHQTVRQHELPTGSSGHQRVRTA
jgi:dimethylargininase